MTPAVSSWFLYPAVNVDSRTGRRHLSVTFPEPTTKNDKKAMNSSHMTALSLFTAGLLTLLAGASLADEVTEQIDAGRKAYDSGELRQAMQELQFAVAGIQQRLNERYVKLLPTPLAGWTAEEAESQGAGMTGMLVGTSVTRRYHKDSSGEGIEINLLADSPMLQAMMMMLSNPMLMQSDPGTKPYRHQGHSGFLKQDKASDTWELNLIVANRILVQISGHGLSDKEPLELYLKAMDLSAIEKAFST